MPPGNNSRLLWLSSLLVGFVSESFVVDVQMHSFCLLASVALILIANCSLLYLHSIEINSLESIFLEKSYI